MWSRESPSSLILIGLLQAHLPAATRVKPKQRMPSIRNVSVPLGFDADILDVVEKLWVWALADLARHQSLASRSGVSALAISTTAQMFIEGVLPADPDHG